MKIDGKALYQLFKYSIYGLLTINLYVFFSQGMQPLENTLVARLSSDRFRSTAYGIKFTLSFGVGALAVLGVATVERVATLQTVFLVAAGFVVAIVVCATSLWLWSRRSIRTMV